MDPVSIYGIVLFNFVPKIISVFGWDNTSTGENFQFYLNNSYNTLWFITTNLLKTSFIKGVGLGMYFSGNGYNEPYGKKSADGKTIYWYHENGNIAQLNYSGRIYYWFIIG